MNQEEQSSQAAEGHTAKKRLNAVSVKVIYWIDGSEEESHSEVFDSSNSGPSVMGLPPGTQPVKPEPGNFDYSGMHDGGPLPPLREGGDMALLLGCVENARRKNDEYMTELIQAEKEKKKVTGPTAVDDTSEENPLKRPKIQGE